jgi:parvulin-like peptidyl-prolyl isomerase
MSAGVLGFVTLGLVVANGGAADLPVVKGKKVVATVQGESITLDELERQMVGVSGGQRPAAKPDPQAAPAVLERMINVMLIAQEGRRMGLDALPENRKMMESQARLTLREELVERIIKDVKVEASKVEEMYRASVRQWKISAALFDREEHAQAMVAELGAGKSFADVAKAFLAEGKSSKVEEGVVLKREATDPAIGNAVAGLTVGAISPIVRTKAGLVIVRLDDVLYPDDPAARAKAEQVVLTNKRIEAVTAFDQELKKKWVKVHRDLLKSIDYEADRPGMEALLKDRRVLAEIKGEKPVTVGEMTEELKFQFFHGTGLAAERKRLNTKKEQVLDGILHRKVFRKEALRLGLDRTDSYRNKVKEFERSTLFDAVVRKAVAPGIKLSENEIKAYYAEHRGEYTTPEMIRIKSLVFADRKNAETALESLRKGADFQWVADRAEGQVDPNAPGVVSFDGRPIMMTELPAGVEKAVKGAKAGDMRLHASPENHVYVLSIQNVVAAQPQPYEQVRQEIAKTMVDAKMQKAVQEYAERLRSLSEVRVYLKAS